MKKLIMLVVVLSGLVGCSAKQSHLSFEEKPKEVCIAEHSAVKNTDFINGLKDGFKNKNANVSVVQGIYNLRNNMWIGQTITDEVTDCDQVVYYVANWSWDGVMYLRFANIWTMNPSISHEIITGRSTYEISGLSGLSLTKFVDSHDKAIELVDKLYQ